jgi:hypothetical protein
VIRLNAPGCCISLLYRTTGVSEDIVNVPLTVIICSNYVRPCSAHLSVPTG